MKRVLVIGATSAIAAAAARACAARGDRLLLAGRDPVRLEALAGELRDAGAPAAEVLFFDALEDTDYAGFAARAWGEGIDLLLLAHGVLPDQQAAQDDPQASLAAMRVNADSAIAMLAAFSGLFEARGRGCIAVISSVAGERGRASNYLYGAAKAALTTYTDGLRNRLERHGVNVLTVKPGFVDTPMTASMTRSRLWAQPREVGTAILTAAERGRRIVYLPWFWRYVMWVIRLIPEPLFVRMRL